MDVSVVIPTFNERDNATALLRRLDAALRGSHSEVVLVDDGTDDLPDVVAALSPQLSIPVRVIRRPVATGRLGGAVVEGIQRSAGDLIVVCDGDLQHPPELIPEMIVAAGGAELVVASRYMEGGDAGGLSSGVRRIVSRATGLLSRITFPRRLKACSDPMSGFFLVRRSALDVARLRPAGFKILLEITGRSLPMRVAEVPLVFGERTAGRSHANMGEGVRFLRQLVALRVANRATLFMLVGASGVLPNLLVLLGLTNAGMNFLPASVIAIQCGVVWNFLGAEFLVWKDQRTGHWARRFLKYLAVGESDLVRIPFVALLVWAFDGHSVIASAITLVAAFFLRFTLADKLVYRRRPAGAVAVTARILQEAA